MTANRPVTAILVAAMILAVVLNCSPKPADVVESYQRAYNEHDLEKLMALYAEDVHFEIVGQFSLHGREQVQDLAEYDFALNNQLFIDRIETRGDTVRCRLEEKNDWLETAGIERMSYRAIFCVQSGLVRSLSAEQSPSAAAVFKRVVDSLVRWAKKERPKRLAEIMPQDTFVYNRENALKSLSLIREWVQFNKRMEGRPAWKKLGG